jgi:hypothetical protein
MGIVQHDKRDDDIKGTRPRSVADDLARYRHVRSILGSGRCGISNKLPLRAITGLMGRGRVPLFDHLAGSGGLLGQPCFPKTINHQPRV